MYKAYIMYVYMQQHQLFCNENDENKQQQKNFPRPCPSNMYSEYNHPTINHKGWTPHEKHNAIGHIQNVQFDREVLVQFEFCGMELVCCSVHKIFLIFFLFSTDWSMRLFFRFYSKFIGAEFYGIIFFLMQRIYFFVNSINFV